MFDKICAFATCDVFKLAFLTGSVPANVYTEDEEKKLLKKDVVEVIREEQWLEEVYGAQSRLESSAWVAKVSREANWIFNPDQMRKKIFTEAGVTMRH